MNEFVSIDDALGDAVGRLDGVSESPRLDAEILLALALDVPRSYLFAHPEDSLDPAAQARYGALIGRRGAGAPLAYITGEKEFWSLTLMVTPDTLIPRPETETLVDRSLTLIGRREESDLLDLGTGSGAIALAIAKERPNCRVIATDVSAAAIAVAEQNARQLELSNVTFVCGNWFGPVSGQQFDVVVSNPPYVCDGDAALESLGYEPRAALVAGGDGLDAIRHIAANAMPVVRPGGSLLLEHGDTQAHDVAAILKRCGWREIRQFNDLAGLPRVVAARRTGGMR